MKKEYGQYFLSLLLFGSNGIVASMIALNSAQIVLLRTLLGTGLLLVLFILTGRDFTCRRHPGEFIYVAVSGIALGAGWLFLYEAYQQIGVSLASLAYYCGPVIVMALSPLLFGEKLTRSKVAGFAAVLFGIVLVNGTAFLQNGSFWGLFCGAMSAILYAVMVIFNKKANHITGMENSLWQLWFSFLTAAVFLALRHGLLFSVALADWGAILFLGLVNTGIGCWFYFAAIGRLPVQSVAICGYLEPLSAVFFSVLILHETMGFTQLLGAALIVGGAIWSEGAGRGRKKRDPRPLPVG